MEKTLKYNPLNYQRNKNTFIEEYYSGPDVDIKMADQTLVNINSIQFQINEQVKPVYGYNSSLFDVVAIGNRIAVGSMKVALKNTTENSELDIRYKDSDTDSNNKESSRPGWTNNNNENDNLDYFGPINFEENENNDSDINSNNNSNVIIDVSSDIKKIQEKLIELGYDLLVNGILDAMTRKAIADFQANNFLNVTGTLTEEFIVLILEHFEYSITKESNVMIGPSESFEKVAVIKAGTRVFKMFEVGEYSYIGTTMNGNSIEGYIKTSSLDLLS